MDQTDQKKNGIKKGALIAFEGIDGSGKSTQIRLLHERMKKEGVCCETTMEPTHSPIGSLLRQILTGQLRADSRTIAALFAADRLDHLLNEENGIVKPIQEGAVVITDRYYFSSYAYHSVDVPMDWVIQLNQQAREILRPAASFFIDVDPETAMERILKSRSHQELFEKKSYLIQVREKYLEAFQKMRDVETVIRIDGNRSETEIAQEIWSRVCDEVLHFSSLSATM
jgi:dTMP kinase